MVGSSGEAAVMQFEQQQQQGGSSSTNLAKLQVQMQKRSSEQYCNSASMESGSTSAEETTTSSTVVPAAAGSCEASMWEGWTSTHDDDDDEELPTTSSSVSNCITTTTTTNMVTLLTACNNNDGIADLTNMTSSSSGSTSCASARVTNNNNNGFHQPDMISNWLSNFQVDQPSGQPIGNTFMEHHLVTTDNLHLDHQTTLFAKPAQSSSGYNIKLSNPNQFSSSTSSCDTDHTHHLYGKPRPLQLLRSLGPESPISPLALHNGLPHPFGDCWDAGSQPSSPWPPAAHVEGTLKSLGATTLQLLQGGPAVVQTQTHHNIMHMNMMSGSSNSCSEAEQLQAAKRQLFRPDMVNSGHLLGSGNHHHVYSYNYPNHHHDQSHHHQSNGRMNIMVPDHSPDAINILEAAAAGSSSVTRNNHVNVAPGVPNHTEFFAAGPYGTFVSGGSSGSGGWLDHQSYSNLHIHGGGGGGGNVIIGAVRPPKAATEMNLSRRIGQEMNFMRRDQQDRTSSTSGSPISSACVTDCQSVDQHQGGRQAGVKHHRLETVEALSGHHPEDARSPPPKRPNLTVDAPPPFWSRSPMPRRMQEPMRSIATGYAPSPTMSQLMISSQAMECIAVGPALNTNGKPRARRGSATDPQSVYARHRREKINERLKTLQHLVPNGAKVDIVTMLEEAYNYVKFLQQQIKLLKSDEHYMLATPDHYNGIELGLVPMQQMQGLESNA